MTRTGLAPSRAKPVGRPPGLSPVAGEPQGPHKRRLKRIMSNGPQCSPITSLARARVEPEL
eukprot:2272406-Prorocentrum_lima.AAC.1